MSRGVVYKLIFIILLIAFAVVLVLPTIGEREMNIVLRDDSTTEQIEAIAARFSKEGHNVVKNEDAILVRGYGLNDAVMNEARTLDGVKDVKFIPHWAEAKPISAKRINLGLDLQGGMQLVLIPNYEALERRLGKKLSEPGEGRRRAAGPGTAAEQGGPVRRVGAPAAAARVRRH